MRSNIAWLHLVDREMYECHVVHHILPHLLRYLTMGASSERGRKERAGESEGQGVSSEAGERGREDGGGERKIGGERKEDGGSAQRKRE